MAMTLEVLASGSYNDNRVILTNSSIARQMSIGNSWSKLRIGMRCVVESVGTMTNSGPTLWMGVMATPSSSMENGPLGIQCSNFAGVYTTPDYTWTDSGGNYSTSNTCCYAGYKNGSAISSSYFSYLSTAYGYIAISNNVAVPMALVVEITKGTPNYTYKFARSQGGAIRNFDKTELLTAMTASNWSNLVTSFGYQDQLDSVIIETSEIRGNLNSVVVGWNRTVPKLYIHEVAYAVMTP